MLPVVLLHAFPLDSRMYDPLRRLLPDVDLLTPDLAGFGVSPRSASEPSLDVMADDVASALADRGVDQAIIGGTSMGGYVSMALLARHPGLAAALLLLDTKASADDDAAALGRQTMAQRLESENTPAALVEQVYPKLLGVTTTSQRPDVAATVRGWVDEADPRSAAWAQRAMAARLESFTTLADSDLPALIVVGDEDVLSPPADAEQMARSWRGARVATIPRAGHLAVVERPDAVAGVVGEFLAEVG